MTREVWPPLCEAPDCTNPREPGIREVTVDHGTYTATYHALCAAHLARWAPTVGARR